MVFVTTHTYTHAPTEIYTRKHPQQQMSTKSVERPTRHRSAGAQSMPVEAPVSLWSGTASLGVSQAIADHNTSGSISGSQVLRV